LVTLGYEGRGKLR